MRTSLLPPEGRAAGPWDRPSPLLLALCASEDTRRHEKKSALPKDHCSYSIGFHTFAFLASDIGNSRGHITLKGQSPAFSFAEVRSPRILQLIWFSDGQVSCDLLIGWVLLSCTWCLRNYLWRKETRDQLDSGPDHTAWLMNSPVCIRFQESSSGETRIFSKWKPA